MSTHGSLITFLWNEPYEIDPSKKYLVYYRGCFCPPTKGHFSLVKKWIQFPNVTVFIAQIGYSKRHGVPYKYNKRIWKLFIEKSDLTEEQQKRIVVKRLYGASDMEPFLDRADIVLYIKGNEKEKLMQIQQQQQKISKKQLDRERRDYEKNFLKERVNMLALLRPLRKPIVFLFDDRTEKNNLSASKLIGQVMEWQKLNVKKLNDEQMLKIRFFLPESLNDETVGKIWKMLSSSKKLK